MNDELGVDGEAAGSSRTRWSESLAIRLRNPRGRVRAGGAARRRTSRARTTRRMMLVAETAAWRLRDAFRLAYYVMPLTPARAQRAATEQPSVAARARIIANPMSGTIRGALGIHAELSIKELEETAAWLTEHGLPTELCLTEYAGHAAELAAEAVAAGMDMVIAAGGDGTVNSVLQALAGHDTALGVLPLGTVNVWAREMGIPLALPLAAQVLVDGVRRRVDVGRAGSRYFLMMAGIGFDAEVARRVERSKLKRVGLKLLDYLATVGVLGVTHRPARVWIRTDGKRRSLNSLMIILGNTRLYGGALTFAKKAVADDGWLDLVVIGGGGAAYRAGVLLRALFRRASMGPRVRYAHARSVRLESNKPVPVQVDGEVIGSLPMTFAVVPSALTVVVPRNAPAALFSRPPLTSPGAPRTSAM
jgi:diacylglycerol kinase (ATP)